MLTLVHKKVLVPSSRPHGLILRFLRLPRQYEENSTYIVVLSLKPVFTLDRSMQVIGQTVSLWQALATLLAAAFAQGFYKLYRARAKFWALQREHGIVSRTE